MKFIRTVPCNHRLVYFGGYGYEAEADHRGTFELDENSLMVGSQPIFKCYFKRRKNSERLKM